MTHMTRLWGTTTEGWLRVTQHQIAPFGLAGPKIERLARFIRSHPGFYICHHARGVVVAVECVQVDDTPQIPKGTEWSEYQTVLTMAGAREALGY